MNRKVIIVSESINEEINNNIKSYRNETVDIMKDYYLGLVLSRTQESMEKLASHYTPYFKNQKLSFEDLMGEFNGMALIYALENWDESKGDFLAYWQICIYSALRNIVAKCKTDRQRLNYESVSGNEVLPNSDGGQVELFDKVADSSFLKYDDVEFIETYKKIVEEFAKTTKGGEMMFFEILSDEECKANWVTYLGRTSYDGTVRSRRKRLLDKFKEFLAVKGYNTTLFTR